MILMLSTWFLLSSISVKVKWGKEVFNDVEANTDEEPILFKAQLFALTGVQNERQKVMLKGATLKDADWGNIKLKDVSLKNIVECEFTRTVAMCYSGGSCFAHG